MTRGDDFLSRWSRRKRAADTEPAMDLPAVPSATLPEEPEDAAQHAANRAAAEAVEIARLTRESDLSVFFRKGVPGALKNRALAAVWRSDPVYSNLDGLVEYGQDYTDPKRIMTSFTSAWQAGCGYLREAAAMAEDADRVCTPTQEARKQPPADPAPVPEAPAAAPVQPPPPDLEPGMEESAEDMPHVSLRRRLGLDGRDDTG